MGSNIFITFTFHFRLMIFVSMLFDPRNQNGIEIQMKDCTTHAKVVLTVVSDSRFF